MFVYSYEPSDGTIMEYMLIRKFHLEPSMFAVADMVSYVTLILGSLFFDAYLRTKSIVQVILWTNIISLLLMVSRNLFITDRIEVDANVILIANCFIGAFIGQISFLPFAIIAAKLCPKNLEGTAYAFFMAMSNLAGIISRELSGLFTNMFNIKNTTSFDKRDMDGFYILCIVLDVIGLAIILVKIKPFTIDSTYANTTPPESEADSSDSGLQMQRLHETKESSAKAEEMMTETIEVLT